MVSAGIDVGEARKGHDLVVLTQDRVVQVSLGGLTLDQVARTVGEVRPSVVCIDSPPAWATSGRSRQAERGLAQLGMSAFATPPDPGDHPFYAWMRAGFDVYATLSQDFPRFTA